MDRAERGGDVVGGLSSLAALAPPVALAETRVLPVLPDLAGIFPEGGLRRGATMVVAGPGSASLVLAVLAEASAAGSWCAMVTIADLGVVAVAEAGLELDRVVFVPEVPPSHWAQVTGALLDAVDVVVGGPPSQLRAADARRLSSRARERGTVLVILRSGRAWSEGADIRLGIEGSRWCGPDRGHGRLEGRQVEIALSGRGAAACQRRVRLWLPAPGGGVRLVSSDTFAGSDIDAGPGSPVGSRTAG